MQSKEKYKTKCERLLNTPIVLWHVSVVLFLIVVVTIMNGYKIEGGGRGSYQLGNGLVMDCNRLRELCHRIQELEVVINWCIMYCHNCPHPECQAKLEAFRDD
jgi:hypothetical protein